MYELEARKKGEYIEIPLELLDSSPFQHRETEDRKKLEELKKSMHKEGLLQPIVAIRKGERYEIVAGHRRTEAARQLGWRTIDAKLIDALNTEEKTLMENLVRENINPVEKAKGIDAFLAKKLGESYKHNIRNIEARLARGEPVSFQEKEIIESLESMGLTVGSALKLVKILELPDDIKDMIEFLGHGRTQKTGKIPWLVGVELSRIPNETVMREVANYFADNRIGIQKGRELITKITRVPDRYKEILKGRGFDINPTGQLNSTISQFKAVKMKMGECVNVLNELNQSQLSRLFADSETTMKRIKEFQKSVTDLME